MQQKALSLLQMATQHSLLAAIEFDQLGGMYLLQQVLRTPKAAVGKRVLDVSETV